MLIVVFDIVEGILQFSLNGTVSAKFIEGSVRVIYAGTTVIKRMARDNKD